MFDKENFKNRLYENYTRKTYKENNFFQKNIHLKEHSHLYKIKNLAAITLVGAVIGTGVYATYQAIKKGPDYNWAGDSIKFNDEYEKYSIEINKQIAETPNQSKLTLETINYDGGYAVFEFDFAVSKEDKEYFELGEKIFTDEEIEKYKAEEIGFYTSRMNSYDESLNVSREEYIEKYQNKIEAVNNAYEKSRELRHSFEFINLGKLYGFHSEQNVEKVSENEYKIYYYYFITDEEFDENGKFTIALKNMQLLQSFDKDTLKLDDDSGVSITISNEPIDKMKTIDLKGEFEYTLSKNKELKVIKPNMTGYKYDILTQYIDDIRITPMQTIVKVKSKFTGIKKHTLSTSMNEWNDPEFIGMLNFKIYDENMNSIDGLKVQAKRDVIFEDGHIESWDEYQAGPKAGQTIQIGQNMEIIDYVIISNTDYNGKFYVYPTRNQEIEGGGSSYDVELGKGYIIDLEKVEERAQEKIEDFEDIGPNIPEEEIISTTLTGVVEEVLNEYIIYVKEVSENGEILVGNFKINVDRETEILKDGKKINLPQKVGERRELPKFEVGQKIKVVFNFEKEKMYPGFLGVAYSIEILDE